MNSDICFVPQPVHSGYLAKEQQLRSAQTFREVLNFTRQPSSFTHYIFIQTTTSGSLTLLRPMSNQHNSSLLVLNYIFIQKQTKQTNEKGNTIGFYRRVHGIVACGNVSGWGPCSWVSLRTSTRTRRCARWRCCGATPPRPWRSSSPASGWRGRGQWWASPGELHLLGHR